MWSNATASTLTDVRRLRRACGSDPSDRMMWRIKMKRIIFESARKRGDRGMRECSVKSMLVSEGTPSSTLDLSPSNNKEFLNHQSRDHHPDVIRMVAGASKSVCKKKEEFCRSCRRIFPPSSNGTGRDHLMPGSE